MNFYGHETGKRFKADGYGWKGKTDEYMGFNIGYRRLVCFTGIYPAEIGYFDMTEKKLSGRQR